MKLIKQLKDEAALIDAVSTVYPVQDWDDGTLRDFLYELIGIGIKTAEEFTRRFTYVTDESRPFRDFTWYYYWELMDKADELIALTGLVIDYTRTWEFYLVHYYCCFRFNGETHFYKHKRLADTTP